MLRIVLSGIAGVALALAIGWFVVSRMMARDGAARPAAETAATTADALPDRKIRATLFYVAEDGMRLVAVDREVAFGEDTVTQARRLVEAQLEPAPAPLAQALPRGTAVRNVFVTERGDAFVDLSKEVTTQHPGGSLQELFSVYAIVDALTVNLPAITRVQILVDGKEVDTLAGHVDLRSPLRKSFRWVAPPAAQTGPPAPATP
jgi:hypothetical protein